MHRHLELPRAVISAIGCRLAPGAVQPIASEFRCFRDVANRQSVKTQYTSHDFHVILRPLCEEREVSQALLSVNGLLHRNDNLFKDLDSRALTAAEEDIIAQRVALQRRMLEEYEKRERARKVPLSLLTVNWQAWPLRACLCSLLPIYLSEDIKRIFLATGEGDNGNLLRLE